MRAMIAGLAAGIALLAAGAAQAAPPADYAARADAAIAPYVKDGLFSGAVLVAKDGQVVFRRGYGLADREWDAPVTPDTEFRLGSMTKQFTATAILQLAEQGKLGLDDPISKYDPAAPAAWSAVTIRELLTHTSGIPSYTDIPGFFDQQARIDRSPAEIIALTADKPLDFPPGTKFVYDNTGYIILGFIIEKVSGQPYAAYLQSHIFGPLGMSHTGYDVSGVVLPHRASGYVHAGDTVRNAPFLSMTLPYAAGSLYSDVDDLLIWDQALYAAKPLDAASLKAMFTDYGHGYGFGYFIQTEFGHRLWQHGGNVNGFASFLERYPDDHLTVIVLSNFSDAPAQKIADELAGLYFGVAPEQAITLGPEALEQDVGNYQLDGPPAVLRVTRDGDQLYARLNLPKPMAFYPKSPTTFFARAGNAEISFDAPVDGKATGVVLHQGGVDRPGKRVDDAQAARLDAAMAARAQEALLGAAPHTVVKVDPGILDGYVGAYRVTPALVLTVTRDGDKLFGQATGQPLVELFPQSQQVFFVTVAAITLTFQPDASGKATAVVVHQGGADITAPRIAP